MIRSEQPIGFHSLPKVIQDQIFEDASSILSKIKVSGLYLSVEDMKTVGALRLVCKPLCAPDHGANTTPADKLRLIRDKCLENCLEKFIFKGMQKHFQYCMVYYPTSRSTKLLNVDNLSIFKKISLPKSNVHDFEKWEAIFQHMPTSFHAFFSKEVIDQMGNPKVLSSIKKSLLKWQKIEDFFNKDSYEDARIFVFLFLYISMVVVGGITHDGSKND